MRDGFQIERQGKTYVLYAGLLDEFHQTLPDQPHVIDTQLLQAPDDENGNVAIVSAFCGIHDDEGVWLKKFKGIGDASPENVNRAIAKHLIRMAETRAKARALRDLVNVASLIFEDEAPPVDDERPTGQDEPNPHRVDKETGEVVAVARKSQIDMLTTLATEWRGDEGPERLAQRIGKPLNELTRTEADDWINRLTPESRV